MKKLPLRFSFFFVFILLLAALKPGYSAPGAKDTRYFQLKIYHYTSNEQESVIDNYLQNTLISSLHASGISSVGVFKALANDTASDKTIYVFIPYSSLKQWEKFSTASGEINGTDQYTDAPYDKPAFSRIENIFLRAFELMPKLTPSALKGAKNERVYELRSYESASEKLYRNKVKMFNQGGEIGIFSRLGFNAVFYGEVIFGCKMPNLMYMTSFENMQSRDEHWKAFGEDAAWKKLSSMPEYQKNVSHSDIYFLKPTEYSEL